MRLNALLIGLLILPVLTLWIGHPPREQAYAAMTSEAGPIGMEVRTMTDPGSADILVLGSSVVREGLDVSLLEQQLARHLGRPAHVRLLAINWQGLDIQYFLLRDYLRTHRAGMILWNAPAPGVRTLEPQVQAFRWARFGEYADALDGLALPARIAFYGDFVYGAPRELLTHLRPNLLSDEELAVTQDPPALRGYYGAPFVPEALNSGALPSLELTLQTLPYPMVRQSGRPLDPFERHFASRIIALAAASHTPLVTLHLPLDSEFGDDFIPEREAFTGDLRTGGPMVGVSSAVLFHGMDAARVRHYYYDQHFNANGRALYTNAVLPAILRAYDTREARHDASN